MSPLLRLSIAILALLVAAPGVLAQQQPMPVRVAQVEQRPITLANRLVATVEPIMRTTLAAEQPALLRERNFDEGQEIEAGAVMAKLDDSLLLRRLATAEAAARSAEAELKRARLNEQNLLRERERIAGLYERGAATEKEYLDTSNDYDRAAASVTVAEADLAEREAAVGELQLQIEKTVVVAPFAGVVNRRYVEVGQWVKQGDPVAELIQLDPLYVRTGVPEDVLSRLGPGATAIITVDALGGRQFQGQVAEILPAADPESRTFTVRLRVDNAERVLRPGMFARVTVAEQDDSMLVVPKDSIVMVRGRPAVILAEQGVARTVPVELGGADEMFRAVRGEGLKAGDLVVTRGNEGMMDGTPLMIQNPPSADGPGGPAGGHGGGGPGGPATRPAGGESNQ